MVLSSCLLDETDFGNGGGAIPLSEACLDCDSERVAGGVVGVDDSGAAASDETCDVATFALLGCSAVPGAGDELLASVRALFLGAMTTLHVMQQSEMCYMSVYHGVFVVLADHGYRPRYEISF